jgi:outer membrane protein TolC
LLGISSCTIDKQYSLQQPVEVSRKWSTTDPYLAKPLSDAHRFAWWQQYHDPFLNKLIAAGLKHNNDIKIAMANIEAAEGELKRVELNWLPTLTGNLGYSSFPYVGYPGVLALMALPLYTVNVFNQIKSQQYAYYSLKVTKSMRDGVKLTVITNITAAYFSHLAQIERLNLLKRVEEDLAHSLRINMEMYAHGIASNIDVNVARARLRMVQGEEKVIEKNLILTQNALRYLINQNPHPFIFKQKFEQVSTSNMVVYSLPLEVLRHRPDMDAAIHELETTRSGIGIAMSRFLPEFTLGLSRGDIATIPDGHTLGTAIHFNQSIVSQPVITLASLGELRKARGLSKASYFRYINTLRKALRDVDDDLASHRYFSERLSKTISAKMDLGNAYNLNRDLYKQGLSSYLELLEHKIKYDEIQIVVNQHKIDQILTLIHLYEDMAVGYDYQIPKEKSIETKVQELVYEKLTPSVLRE